MSLTFSWPFLTPTRLLAQIGLAFLSAAIGQFLAAAWLLDHIFLPFGNRLHPEWDPPATFLLAIPLLLFAADRLLLKMARRGWIYYRNNKRKSTGPTAIRGVLSTFQEIVQPEIRYVQEDRDQRHTEPGEQDRSKH